VDSAVLKRVARELQRHGIKVWYSERHIAGAQQWLDEIGRALKRCDWCIVLLTPAAVKSKWVKHEVSWAVRAKRYDGRILPVLVTKCKYDDLSWTLGTFQMLKLTKSSKCIKDILGIWNVAYIKK